VLERASRWVDEASPTATWHAILRSVETNDFVALPLMAALVAASFLLLARALRSPATRRREDTQGSKTTPPAIRQLDEDVDLTRVGLMPLSLDLPIITLDPEGESTDVDSSGSKAMTVYEEGVEPEEPTASKKLVLVCASGHTDVGRKRRRNEDSILLLHQQRVFAVIDGMGGYAGGDVASKLATETLESTFHDRNFPGPLNTPDRPRSANELVWAIEQANRKIREEAKANPKYEHMGATLVSARFAERKQRVFIAHVGDSRCYRLRSGHLQLLTTDHTLSAYGVTGPMGSRVRRALGVKDTVKVDVCVDKPQPGDMYLLCSDGLSKMVDDLTIESVLKNAHDRLEDSVHNMIDLANQAGGRDNVSVILVGVYSAQAAA
jgi:serine/threonine protein phosphatase PrpC